MNESARRRVVPGFGISLGYAVAYLSLVVLIPLCALVVKSAGLGAGQVFGILKNEQVQSAFFVTFSTALVAAVVNVPLGLLVAWVLGRYSFFGRRFLDALIDLPFALPTAVAGIALSFLYSQGWMGQFLEKVHFHYPWVVWGWGEGRHWPLSVKWFETVGLAPLGIVMALVFVGMPFVIRTIQPVLEDMDRTVEEAGASLGATRGQVFWRVVLPQVRPALVTGFALAFARGIGEYGSVIYIAGRNSDLPIVPGVIIDRLEQYDIAGSTAVAALLLVASFGMLLGINVLQRRAAQWGEK